VAAPDFGHPSDEASQMITSDAGGNGVRGPWFALIGLLIVLVGIGLRVPHLTTRSLWFDEALAANNSRGSLAETVTNTRTDNSSPILYPILLYVLEKIGHDELTLRGPSFVSSILLIALILLMGRNLIGPRAALIAAFLVALAPSQIRYAQEVREYALGSLVAGAMTYAYLAFAADPGRRNRLLLCGVLALAPIIQYGLVLYGIALLGALSVAARRSGAVSWRDVALAGACFGSAGLFSLLFTLRYQWGGDVWYLKDFLFRADSGNPVQFTFKNALSLLRYISPGEMAAGVVALGLGVLVVVDSQGSARLIRILVVVGGGVGLAAALGHAYPFGGVRQCLYLAPLLCIAAGVGLEQLLVPLKGFQNIVCMALIATICAVSARGSLSKGNPYENVEETPAILARLSQKAAAADDVYIYYGARPTVEFYVEGDKRKGFIFGKSHRVRPQEYAREILEKLPSRSDRLWLVFSHLNFDEDRLIVRDLQLAGAAWTVTEQLRANDAVLYEATREAKR
jgi:hypothetical protein